MADTAAHPAQPASIIGYHAHVYYDPADPASRERAAQLRGWVEAQFTVRMGRWHDVPVGPHPRAMYQIAFEPDQFSTLVPFLMLNRQGLTVLVHPETGDDYIDHADHAVWLGAKLPLNLEFLRRLKAGA